MNSLLVEATQQRFLRAAWYSIRANGICSPLQETKDAIEEFQRNTDGNIIRMQRLLRNGKFLFDPQKGIIKKKGRGGKRGIVMASVENRIVERALLDCLQKNIPFVRNVIQTPTSVGGIPDRSVPHGLALINDAMERGQNYFVRADISGFFDHIPRHEVIELLKNHITDTDFIRVLDSASTVTLSNEKALGEDRKLFPTDDEGVAQGSPLSALFGNILLNDFDKQFNDRGICCIRFIDDFVILGDRERYVRKAFEMARQHLSALGLQCHDPFDPKTPKEKAQYGQTKEGFVFLGYHISPGLFQPSKEARKSFNQSLDLYIRAGRSAIQYALGHQYKLAHRQRYTQTIYLLDRVIQGWGNAFAYTNARSTLLDLDRQIDRKLASFRDWYRRIVSNADRQTFRRTFGVCLLEDIEQKKFEEVPFRLPKLTKYRRTKNMIFISTDGSLVNRGKRTGLDKGPGGWSVIFHNEVRDLKGFSLLTTNNEMELTAIIKALESTSIDSRVHIRTDSRYVYQAAQGESMIRANTNLWKTYHSLSEQRRVSLEWIKSHAGDQYNERADQLAKKQANLAAAIIKAKKASTARTHKDQKGA